MTESPSGDLAYCAEELRRDDPDRFATAMLAPPRDRARLIAVYAFNLEVARLRESVSEPMLGEIRLQWWRDAVGECVAGTPRRHQVVQPLAAAVREAGLPEAVMLEAIDARARDLDDLPPADEGALARYVDATGGAVGELACRALLGMETPARAVDAGRAAGRAWAWAGLARGLHLHAVLGRQTVPGDVLARSPGLADAIRKAEPNDAVRDWTRRLIMRCRDDLSTLSDLKRRVPRSALPALAPARLARVYADRIEAADFDPFRPDDHRLNPGRRAWLLIGTKYFGRL
jgi:phytoene synthase